MSSFFRLQIGLLSSLFVNMVVEFHLAIYYFYDRVKSSFFVPQPKRRTPT